MVVAYAGWWNDSAEDAAGAWVREWETNNGNVASQTIYVNGNLLATQNYVYDAVNRLKSAQEGTAWKETNGFDSRGNRWVDEANTSGLPLLTNEVAKGSTWFDTKNRLVNTAVGFGYDNAGNLTAVTSMGRTFEYDVENRQVVAVVNGKRTQYSYDGEGRRVMKLECPGTSVCTGATAGAKKTVFVYDAGGKLAQEYGELAPATLRSYVFDDHLGSTRMKLSGAGVVEGWWDYLPFGGEIPGALSGRNAVAGFAYGGVRPAMMFTGKERDAETGLDYFGGQAAGDQRVDVEHDTSTKLPGRYYSSAQGRFTSPDLPLLDQDPQNPQSWNLFSYVRNNPLVNIDPTGHCAQGPDGKMHDDADGKCADVTSVTVTEKAPKVRDVAAEVQAEMVRMQYENWKKNQEKNKPKEDQPLTDNAKKVLTVAYERTAHDLGCVGLGGLVTGGAGAASAPIIPKGFSQGGASSTSVASTVLGGGNIGRGVPTPVGMPGTSSFAWRSSANLGRIAGRYLPYIGTVAGAGMTLSCLGSNP